MWDSKWPVIYTRNVAIMFGHLPIMKHSQGVNICVFVKQNKSAIVQQKCCNFHGCLISKVAFLFCFVLCYQATLMLTGADGTSGHYMCVLIPPIKTAEKNWTTDSQCILWFRWIGAALIHALFFISYVDFCTNSKLSFINLSLTYRSLFNSF